MNVQCPQCNGAIQNNPQLAGQNVTCPHCSTQFVMPGQSAKPAVPQEGSPGFDFSQLSASDGDERRPRSVSQRHGQQKASKRTSWPLWLKIALPAFGVMVLCCGGLRGCSGGGWEYVSVADFIDNTADYRGDELEFEMQFFPMDEISLRLYSGGMAPFYLYDMDSDASADMYIQIPRDLNVPNAGHGDTLIVRFVCNDGQFVRGNVATSIERP